MRVRFLAVMMVVVTLGAWNAACSELGYYGGTCSVTDDCRTYFNYYGGTECRDEVCTCPNPHEAPCCPDGGTRCVYFEYECRPKTLCEAGHLQEISGASSSVGGTSSSGGPIVPTPPGAACTTDEECAEPLDYRCGLARCNHGKCGFEIAQGEAIASQYPGDCKVSKCDFDGSAKSYADTIDVPHDANPCTFDICEGDLPSNVAFPDGTPCQGTDFGICVLRNCQECSLPLGIDNCKPGEFCDWDRCVPFACDDNAYTAPETDVDCGGPDCVPCPADYGCMNDSDCFSGVCVSNVCQASTHTDGVKNGGESGKDCGYPEGPFNDCPDHEGCRGAINCMSKVCFFGTCQVPTCEDDTWNGAEAAKDCGGLCPPCP